METKGHRQLMRVDYHRCNSGHGGATGLQTRELSVWMDGNYHYHVMSWHQ